MEILKNIAADFEQPLGYLAVILGILLLLILAAVITRKHKAAFKKLRTEKRWMYLLFLIYVAVLLQTAFFSREPGSRTGVDLTLFETWGTTPIEHAYFIENILMYLPFGILAPLGWKWMQKGWRCVLLGCCSSMLLEFCQYLTQRGYCQLDDVLTNTIGAWIGWCIWKTGKLVHEHWSGQLMNHENKG